MPVSDEELEALLLDMSIKLDKTVEECRGIVEACYLGHVEHLRRMDRQHRRKRKRRLKESALRRRTKRRRQKKK